MKSSYRVIQKAAVRLLRSEIPNYTLGGAICQAITVTVCWADWELIPAYLFHPIYTGYAIAVLGVMAVVMAARAQHLTKLENVIWIVLAAFLFSAEIHVINDDHQIQNNQHLADLKGQSDSFTATLEKLTKNSEASSKQFDITMNRFSKEETARQQEFNVTTQGFAGVLTKQDQSFQEQRNLSEQFMGRLVPGDRPTPQNACGLQQSKGEVLVITGDNADIAKSFPHTILEIGDLPIISVDRVGNTDELALSVDIRDKQNRVAFRMDKNGVVNRSGNLLFLHPDKSTFLLQNDFGEEVFRAQFLNPTTFQLTGKVAYCGQSIPVQNPMSHQSCSAFLGEGTHITAPSCPKQQ